LNAPLATGARKAALIFIFITVLIDVLAFGVIIPVLPHLVQQFVGGDTSTAAYWVGAFAFAFSLVQFFSAPIQGALSDRYGRRPVILVSCLGLGLDFVFMALAPNLAWLFVGRIISAVTSASFTTANAYIADVTAPEARAKSFGMIGAAFGLGFIVGRCWAACRRHRPSPAVLVPACLPLLNFCCGLFVLRNRCRRRSARRCSTGSTPGRWAGSTCCAVSADLGLVAVAFVANFAHYVYPSTFVLFADASYGWKEKQAGYVLSVVGVSA
jgi:DHA1 family tetracycline resistance protein-like MFS transporter